MVHVALLQVSHLRMVLERFVSMSTVGRGVGVLSTSPAVRSIEGVGSSSTEC